MNFFRRLKKNSHTGESKDKHVFNELYNLLRTHGDAILSGSTKLSLTADILILLNGSFRKLTKDVNQPCFQVATETSVSDQTAVLNFIFDFIQKVISLKLISGAVSSNCPLLSTHHFKSVEILEIRKVAIKYIKNLHSIRRQLTSLTCCRSTDSVTEVINQFGKGNDDLYVLPVLKVLDLSYNTIKSLNDESFKLLPALEVFNGSFNCIENADSETLPSICYLNLGYNTIVNIPILPNKLSNTLTHLILRNNNISSLIGIQVLSSLVLLDLTSNCVITFEELFPLGYLEYLVKLSLIDNPISYNKDYRVEIIRKLSPVRRLNKISLDGRVLDSTETCHLGQDVQPKSLLGFIPQKPIGKPNKNVSELVNSLSALSHQQIPTDHSTPIMNGRINKAKVRQAVIADSSTHHLQSPSTPSSFEASISSASRKSISSFGNKSLTESLNNMYTSRRNSHDNSLEWVNVATGSIKQHSELARSLPKLDYDSYPVNEIDFIVDADVASYNESIPTDVSDSATISSQDENGVYHKGPMMSLSRVEQEINASSETECTVIRVRSEEYEDHDHSCEYEKNSTVDSDSETEYPYLVQSIIRSKDDNFLGEENELLFLAFKQPYLLEKGDDGKLRNKLDLNYLKKTSIDPTNELRLTIRFDLMRSDWQIREYEFDQKEQLDSFLNVIQPIEVKMYQKRIAEMKNCECLKCGTLFLNDPNLPLVCPQCQSTMIVDKNDNMVPTDQEDRNSIKSSNLSVSDHSFIDEPDGGDISSRYLTPNTTFTLPEQSKEVFVSSSWPPNSERMILPALSSTLPDNFLTRFKALVTSSQLESNNDHSRRLSQTSYRSKNSDADNIYTKCKPPSVIESQSPSSPMSSIFDSYPKGHSRQHSKSSVRSKTPRSAMNTPATLTKGTLFNNMNDFTKCDHRFKLHFSMNTYNGENEDFLCQIRSYCVSYNKLEKQDCLLNFSNQSVNIFAITDLDSDSPEECLKKITTCSITQLKYVYAGYFQQSFTIDFTKIGHHYKFLVGDREITNRFLRVLQEKLLEEIPSDQQPTFSIESNPQTDADIRTQVFNIKESLKEKIERIYQQLTMFTSNNMLKVKKIRLRTHQNCFTAKEFIDWLVARRETKSRTEAVELGEALLQLNFIHHVSKEQKFKDDDGLFKFTLPDKSIKENQNSKQTEDDMKENNDDDIDTVIQHYLICRVRINELDSALHLRTIITTQSHVFLTEECHQWPLSCISPPPSLLSDHYSVKDCNKITNVKCMEFYEDSPCHVTISFVNEDSNADSDETNWLIRSETFEELLLLTSCIKKTWEELFAIEFTTLTVSSVIPVLDSYILV